jgi:glutamyl-tRNA reductase
VKLILTGLSHHTAPVEVRERLAFEEKTLPDALTRLTQRPGMVEGMILSTCNRVEVAVTTDGHADARESLDNFLAEARSVEPAWVSPYLYHYNDQDAIRHMFRVASSLDSMVVGEPQILGQLKSAYSLAKEHGTLSGFLDQVVTRAFNVAKRVRTETEIGSSAVSVSYAAVELARDIFGSLKGKRVLLVGAGKMAESAARHLRRAGVVEIYVTNRTRSRADLIASSGAPHYILTTGSMREVMNRRRNRPMFLIDIAVPRNIEPAVNEQEGVFLYDIDDLGRVVTANLQTRKNVAEQAEEIIDEEVQRMLVRLKTREVTPTIVELQDHLEHVRAAEIERLRGKLGVLSPQQEEAIEAITRGIVNKIAHTPITELRRKANDPDGIALMSTIRKLFRLGEN